LFEIASQTRSRREPVVRMMSVYQGNALNAGVDLTSRSSSVVFAMDMAIEKKKQKSDYVNIAVAAAFSTGHWSHAWDISGQY
jgi:hypothetical protein